MQLTTLYQYCELCFFELYFTMTTSEDGSVITLAHYDSIEEC